jgi:hypothetical protein
MRLASGRRGGFVVALTCLLLGALAAPALAVGADGVSMQVNVPRDADQRMPMLVDGAPASGEILLRNRNDEPRTVRLYAASAAREEQGAISLGNEGSAPWVGLRSHEVALSPGETRVITFTLDPARVPADTDGRLPTAFVLRVPRGETVVMQAVSLLSVTGATPPAIPWYLLLVAVLLLLGVGQQSVRQLHQRRPRVAAHPAPVPA